MSKKYDEAIYAQKVSGEGSRSGIIVGNIVRYSKNKKSKLGKVKEVKQRRKKLGKMWATETYMIIDPIEDNPKRRATKKKKATHKKNPKRSCSDWVIFQYDPRTNNVAFLHASNQWVNRKLAVKFTTKKQAVGIARSARHIKGYRIGVIRSDITSRELCRDLKKQLGRKRTRKSNPVGPTQSQVDAARNLFKDFSGNRPESMQSVKLPVPKTGLVIGELDGVLYTTVRDGKTEKYQHDFKKGSRPALVSSHDGASLHILGGGYEFTERGIEDK